MKNGETTSVSSMLGTETGTQTISSKTPWSEKVFIAAEISGNHCSSIYKAKQLICAARENGADAVKVQIFEPDDLTLDCDNDNFSISGQSLYRLYQSIKTPLEWLKELKGLADTVGLVFFATIYHPKRIPLTEELGIPIYKIASFDTSYRDLIKQVSELNKPVIVSTGQSPFNEIKEIIETIGTEKLCILKCTSKYPAPLDELNLKTLLHIRKKFKVDVGLSDHTDGILAPVVAVSLGARVIEKHICLDDNCPDTGYSITPERFGAMVQVIRGAEKAIGKIWYGRKDKFKRSWVTTKDIKRGEPLTDKNTVFTRTVIKGRNLRGETAHRDYKFGDLLQEVVQYGSKNDVSDNGSDRLAGTPVSQ